MSRLVLGTVSAFLLLFAVCAWGQGGFRIGDIRVEGVQRLDAGTVLTYLPLRVGERLTRQKAQRAIKALYETGLFENVSLSRQGDTLVVKVQERPVIARFSIQGNEAIGGDKLKQSLKEQGLAVGELFRRSLLDRLVHELQRVYYAQGYYSVEIDTDVTQLANNRVGIDIAVQEGPVATIQDINIIGNESFSDERLKEEVFTLEESQPFYADVLTFWSGNDRYSRQRLLGDLEALTSFYQNRGYIRFKVTSIQVELSPDKRDVYLTVNVDEGEQYTIDSYRFAGEMIVPETSVQRLIAVEEGEIFKRSEVVASANRIGSALADFGYAFAEVEPLTEVNDENNTVDLTFFIKPGKRTYVRRIIFKGNKQTNDLTLRREMRQFEGAPFSRRAVQRSRTRLARLPYIKDVRVETRPVPGTKDLVDVIFHVKERPAGTLQFGVGYSDSQGFLVNASVSHSNFLGTGNTVSLSAQTTDFAQSASASWTDPYVTPDGVSRTISAYYRDVEQLVSVGSDFDMTSMGLGVTYGLPISEYSSLRLGLGVDSKKITTPLENEQGEQVVSDELRTFIEKNGRQAVTVEVRTGWERDTRNRSFFATRGSYTALHFDFKIPGSDLEYYTASFTHTRYFRIGDWLPVLSDQFVLSMNAKVAYTDIYGSGSDVPPYANFFAGGPRSVRGFPSGGIGPRDSLGDPYGGQFLTTLQTELTIPTFLESDGESTRLVLFYDIGNVYRDIGDFDTDLLRSSAGVAFYWFTPFFGLLRVSYAPVVNALPGDEVDRFQFSFGVGF